jgi:hypothetical protein
MSLGKGEVFRGYVDLYGNSYFPVTIQITRKGAAADFYVQFDKWPSPSSYVAIARETNKIELGTEFTNYVTNPTSLRFSIVARTRLFTMLSATISLVNPNKSFLVPTKRSKSELPVEKHRTFRIDYSEFLSISLHEPLQSARTSRSVEHSASITSRPATNYNLQHKKNLTLLCEKSTDLAEHKKVQRKHHEAEVKDRRVRICLNKQLLTKDRIIQGDSHKLLGELIVDRILQILMLRTKQRIWAGLLKTISTSQQLLLRIELKKKLSAWNNRGITVRKIQKKLKDTVHHDEYDNAKDMILTKKTINLLYSITEEKLKSRVKYTIWKFILAYFHVKKINMLVFEKVQGFIFIQNRWKAHMRLKRTLLSTFEEGVKKALLLLQTRSIFSVEEVQRSREMLQKGLLDQLFEVLFNKKLMDYLVERSRMIIKISAIKNAKEGREMSKGSCSLQAVCGFNGLKKYLDHLPQKMLFDQLSSDLKSKKYGEIRKIVESKPVAMFSKSIIHLTDLSKKSKDTKNIKKLISIQDIISRNKKAKLSLDLDEKYFVELVYCIIAHFDKSVILPYADKSNEISSGSLVVI